LYRSVKSLSSYHLCHLPRGFEGETNHHPGNQRWRLRVRELQNDYGTASRAEKTQIVERIVESIRPGRFLFKVERSSEWRVVVDLDMARSKVRQALREKKTKKATGATASGDAEDAVDRADVEVRGARLP
jgi:hypothetical protein